jgi:hypothetical protein
VATTRSSLRKELAAKTRSTRSSIKLNQLNLIQPGNFRKPTIKSIRQKDLLAAMVMLLTYEQCGLTYFILSLGRNRVGKCHGTDKDTKRDTRSVEQLEQARLFKKPKQHQLDDDDPNDDDYEVECNSFEEDDDDNDEDVGAPVVVSRTQTSKGSTSCRMIEFEDEEVGYEAHSKISKMLSHSFSGYGQSSTPMPSSQKEVKSVHMAHILLQIIMKEHHTRNAIRMRT